jgi:hypothetical protein
LTVCEWFGLKITQTVFTGLDSKPVMTVCEWFGLKITQTVFTGLALKPVATVSSGLASKPAAMISGGLATKPAATVFSSLASNSGRRFLSVWPQNRRLVSWLSHKTKVVEGFPVWASKLAASVW